MKSVNFTLILSFKTAQQAHFEEMIHSRAKSVISPQVGSQTKTSTHNHTQTQYLGFFLCWQVFTNERKNDFFSVLFPS